MIRLEADSFVVYAAWQSSLWLAAGLLAAALLHRRPARAHAALLFAIVGTLVTPLASAAGRAFGVGLFEALPAATAATMPPLDATAAGSAPFAWLTLERALALVWLGLTSAAVLRLAYGIRGSQRLARRASPIDRPEWRAQAREAARRLGLAVEPELLVSDDVASPVVWCWGRAPRILLPRRPLERGHLHPILCHELAHFARRDHLVGLLAELFACAYLWHPLAWVVRRRLAVESERACDRWVLAAGEAPGRYAEALLGLCAPGGTSLGSTLALPAAGSRRSLARRLDSILDPTSAAAPRAGRAFRIATIAVAILATTGLALAHRRAPSPLPLREHAWVGLPPELAAECSAAGPGLCALPAVLDLGEVAPGATATGSIWIANTDDVVHALVEAKPTCGCVTLVDLAGRVLAPGEVVELPLTMQAPDQPGVEKAKRVVIQSEDVTPLEVEVRLSTTHLGRAGG